MAFQISDFTQRLTGDGARPNLFQVVMSNIPGITGNKLSFMAKSAQLPGSTLGTVPIYYFGREMKFAGNRTFADWTITIINDEDFMIRNAMESWMNAINSNETNVRGNPGVSISATGQNYTTDAQVFQYGKAGPTSANAASGVPVSSAATARKSGDSAATSSAESNRAIVAGARTTSAGRAPSAWATASATAADAIGPGSWSGSATAR